MVGSGTLLPSATRGSAAHHLHTPAASVLLDCGTGTLHGLSRAGVNWRELDIVAVTHFHTDHVTDLPALLAAFRFTGRSRPLSIVGPPGIGGLLEGFAAIFGDWILHPDYVLTVEPMSDSVLSLSPELDLATAPTPHTANSIAYRLAGPWGSMGYTGDTGPSTELGVFFRGVELLVAECGSSDAVPSETHLSPSGLADLIGIAKPSAAVVTHVYPPKEPIEVSEMIALRTGRPVTAGFDGLTMRFENGLVTIDPEGSRL